MGKARRRKQDRVEPAETSHAAAAARPRRAVPRPAWPLLAPAVLLVAGLAAYANSFAIPFLFDDHFEIIANPWVQEFQPALSYLTRSRGIPTFSLAVNNWWGGSAVWGYHLFNLIVHLANAMLVYALVLGTLRLPFFDGRYKAAAPILSLLVALVFVVHPLQTMAVSYIVQRAESIASFFYLSVLVLVLSAARARDAEWRRLWIGTAVVAGVIGVLSKEIVATVPVSALLYYVCFLRPGGRTARRWPLYALLLLVPLALALFLSRDYLTAASDAPAGGPRSWVFIPSAGFQLEGVSPWRYLITQFGVVLWYLRLYVLPTQQCFDYGWALRDSFWRADVLLPLLALLALAGVAIASFRRYRLASFCLGWSFILLAPTSTIIPLRDAAFEHRMYLTVASLAWLSVVGGFDALGWLARRQGADEGQYRQIGALAFGLWLALLGGLTVARNHVYQDPLRLAADSAAKAPGNWRAHYELGTTLLERKRTSEGMASLEEAVRLDPSQGPPRVQLSALYAQAGRLDEAESVVTPATEGREQSVVAAAYRQLGFIALSRRDAEAAQANFERAIQLMPGWVSVREQLGRMYAKQAMWFGAAGHFNEAIKRKPALKERLGPMAFEASYRSGITFYEQGKHRPAMRMFELALEYKPHYAPAHQYLALCYSAWDFWDKAEQEMEAAAAAAPTDQLIAENLRRARAREPLAAP